ncbi:hypothetical protein CRG98_021614 [Punica granatum]|uniref:Reverse transcriptase domain-containing protein n=1 Tax=Punica granatum TaxID=22663 RepID=A0A2I0JP25_PUNGR|nr:hypothetical protein CRG98_021614 [Punica granatum]
MAQSYDGSSVLSSSSSPSPSLLSSSIYPGKSSKSRRPSSTSPDMALVLKSNSAHLSPSLNCSPGPTTPCRNLVAQPNKSSAGLSPFSNSVDSLNIRKTQTKKLKALKAKSRLQRKFVKKKMKKNRGKRATKDCVPSSPQQVPPSFREDSIFDYCILNRKRLICSQVPALLDAADVPNKIDGNLLGATNTSEAEKTWQLRKSLGLKATGDELAAASSLRSPAITSALKDLKNKLRHWNSTSFGNVEEKVLEIESQIDKLESLKEARLLADPEVSQAKSFSILEAPFEIDEITSAVWACKGSKSSGPDVEGFCQLMKKAEALHFIRGITLPNSDVCISLLQFVDTLIFCPNDALVLCNIKRILRLFELISGLKVNFFKSSLLGVGVHQDLVLSLAKDLLCRPDYLPISYLGLPLGVSARKLAIWKPVFDKIKCKLSSWREQIFGEIAGSVMPHYMSVSLDCFPWLQVKMLWRLKWDFRTMINGVGASIGEDLF